LNRPASPAIELAAIAMLPRAARGWSAALNACETDARDMMAPLHPKASVLLFSGCQDNQTSMVLPAGCAS
jgi:hypothetical protein